jgi:uncharacterized protein
MDRMAKPLCIYHGSCDDGFAAAWCVRSKLADHVEFYPGVYQSEPPAHDGRDVIFVDFSYKRPVLDSMARAAKSILILDHHKTAQQDLRDLGEPPAFEIWRRDAWEGELPQSSRMRALFEMERSGATLAWDYFVGGERPMFVEYIEDRDLWRKRLPDVDAFTFGLRSYPQEFETWDMLIRRGTDELIAEGRIIERYYRLRVNELKRSAYRATLAGHLVWIANAPVFAASEAAGELAERDAAAFGACYSETAGGRFDYELRSRGDLDVSAIAQRFGGGGHKNAAGFSAAALVHKTPVGAPRNEAGRAT